MKIKPDSLRIIDGELHAEPIAEPIPAPVLVALGPDDVTPGSALRSEGNTVSGRLILAWGYWGVRTHDHIRLTYETLKDDKWLINRNDGRGFVACEKPAAAKAGK